MRFRNILVNAALVLFSTLLALCAVEVALVLVQGKVDPALKSGNFFRQDKELSYTNKPGARSFLRKPEYENTIRINSEGLRDYEHTNQTPGSRIILCIGDSFTFGEGAEMEESYPWRLEEALNSERPGGFEVVKAGISGYDTVAEAGYLKRLMPRYMPDLVILGFSTNDILDVALGGAGRKGVSSDDVLYLRKSFLGELFAKTRIGRMWYMKTRNLNFIRRLKKIGKPNFAHGDGWSWDFTDIYKVEQPRYIEDALPKTLNAVAEMRAEALKNGARFMVVYIPCKDQFRDKAPEGYDYMLPAKIIAGYCAKESITFYDALQDMEEHGDPQALFYEKDGHMRPEGYALLADGVKGFILSSGILKNVAAAH